MNVGLISMAPVHFVDVMGSSLMILFAFLCVRNALGLRRNHPNNVIWTYLLWFSAGLFLFSISRSIAHLVRYVLIAVHQPQVWHQLRPVTGALNTISFVIVGGITLFFHKIYKIYGQMREDKATIEQAHADIMELNLNLEEMIRERTRDLSISEEKYRVLFEGSKDMIFICDENGRLLDINPSGLELLGFQDHNEVLGRNFFNEFILQDHPDLIRQDLRIKDFLKDVELKIRKRNGEERDVLFSASTRKMDGGRPIGFEGTVKDITMWKAMERQLVQADKLASLGQLSAGVAHEINNPLGLILGYTQLMLKEVTEESQLREDLEIVKRHAMNCKKIVEDLLKFSRSVETTKTSVDINDLIGEVLEVVRANFELDNVLITRKFADDLPTIRGDPDKLKQVFMNLLINARQAIERTGHIMVTTSLASSEGRIEISFVDTGCGIAPEIMHRIFDPFFTTKPTGMGTGLGLSVSYGIIKDHNGKIGVRSELGKGTHFRIMLPVRGHPESE